MNVLAIGSLIGFFAAVAGANIFILTYGILAPWYKKPFGRHLFAFMAVLAVVLDHNMLRYFQPDYPGVRVMTFILTWAICGVIWWRFAILVNVQVRRGREGHINATQDVSQDSNDHLGDASGADTAVVEAVNSLGSSDERLGKRRGPLR